MELVATGPQFLAVMVVGVAFGFGNLWKCCGKLQDFANWNGLISVVQDGRLTFFPDPRIERYTDMHKMIFHVIVYV